MFDMLDISRIEKPSVENTLKNTMNSGLGLDISKTSTGIALYLDDELTTYQCVIEYDSESNLHWYHMVKALEDDLLSLIQGKHFDIIAIENAIQGQNFDTVRKLILLNSVIDKIIAEGNVTCNYFRRLENTEWKKWLRTLKPGKKVMQDKAEIEDILDYLGYHLVEDYRHEKQSVKDKEGYQDKLDAVGVLVGAGLERQKIGDTKIKPKKRKKLRVEVYKSKEDISINHNLSELTQINLGGDLNASVKTFFKELNEDEEDLKFYMVKDSLGTLGITIGVSDYMGDNHIVLYQE